jgi:hypothetical protein
VASIDTQLRLAALLRYYHHGDFSMFKRAAELSGVVDPASDDGFAAPDLLLACHMTGIVDITSTDSERVWWASFAGPVVVRSAQPKMIPTRPEDCEAVLHTLRPVVRGRSGMDLIWAASGSVSESANDCDFRPPFISRLPTVSSVERQVCRSERVLPDLAGGIAEKFIPESARWESLSAPVFPPKSLLRLRRGFGNWAYLIVIAQSEPAIVVADMEWAMLIARNILGWRLDSLVWADSVHLFISRAFRLPGILLRFVFANAESVSVGVQIRANGMSSAAHNAVFDYIKGVSS